MVKILIIYLFFVYFFNTSVFIHFRQLKTAVFQHRCLIHSVLLFKSCYFLEGFQQNVIKSSQIRQRECTPIRNLVNMKKMQKLANQNISAIWVRQRQQHSGRTICSQSYGRGFESCHWYGEIRNGKIALFSFFSPLNNRLVCLALTRPSLKFGVKDLAYPNVAPLGSAFKASPTNFRL